MMSPQPDVALDVQKYIGPCLISQKPRGRKSGRGKDILAVHSSLHHFRKNSGVGPPSPTSLPHSSANSSYTICECCGNFKYMFNGAGAPPTSGNLPWAGFPLISLAGYKKNANKHISHPNGGLPIQRINNHNRTISQSETETVLDSNAVSSLSPPLWDDPDYIPLSKLAIHTQGVPLILSNHVNYKKYKHLPHHGGKFQHSTRSHIKDFKERFEFHNDSPNEVAYHQAENGKGNKVSESTAVSQPLCSQSPVLDSLNQRIISEVDPSRSSPPASDSMSIASDESSGLSECSLPRILKPRKRRKRDRWLLTADPNANIASTNSNGLKTVVTLEPYRPLCYRFNQSDLRDDGTNANVITYKYHTESWPPTCQASLHNESEDENDSCLTNDVSIVEEDLQRYPYPPSPFCTCSICVSSSLPTPPTSPSSGHSSPISSVPSSPSAESFLSLSPSPSSPFPTPPPSPLSQSAIDSESPPWTNSCQVDTKIITTEDGNRDLEIKFLSSANNSNDEKSSSLDNSSNIVVKRLQSITTEQKPTFKTASLIPQTQPPTRPWITLAPPNRSNKSRRPICAFTVMCYNILCDKYATRQMYGYCPNWALNWEYRRKGIMDEMRHYRADIISLQEVETEQFYNMFLPELKKDGYDGIFSPKSRAKTMGESERKYVDGCAIFFRTSKFRLIKERLVEFTQLAMANAEGSDDMLNRVMTKDNIGLAALLETREGAWDTRGTPMDPSQMHQPLLVCTAHIHWDPEFCDVKLIQTMMLMHELKNIVEESAQNFRPGSQKPDCNAIPLILCGDFNSLPESGVCEFLTSGRIASNHPDLKEFGYHSCLRKLSSTENPNEYTHSFKIASAYSDENMPFTNYTFDFKGIIDYILYSETCMSPLGLLGPVDPEWLRVNKVVGCPHPHVPSDHFPLLVEYEMVPHQLPITNGLVTRR